MDKYIVVYSADAVEKGYPDPDGRMKADQEQWDTTYSCLYETDGEKPIRLVGTDRMEPEDATLDRDLGWLVAELNRLAAICNSCHEGGS